MSLRSDSRIVCMCACALDIHLIAEINYILSAYLMHCMPNPQWFHVLYRLSVCACEFYFITISVLASIVSAPHFELSHSPFGSFCCHSSPNVTYTHRDVEVATHPSSGMWLKQRGKRAGVDGISPHKCDGNSVHVMKMHRAETAKTSSPVFQFSNQMPQFDSHSFFISFTPLFA